MINTQSFKLDIKKPTIPRLRVVNGDTANQFVITVQNDGASVTLDADLHKVVAVFTRADGLVYTQDADTGLSFTTGGVVTINVRPASFRTGTNKVCLQIYKRENSSDTTYPLLCTTCEAQFAARSQAIPDSGAPNAPSQLPMLEQLISDAQDAIDDCEDATEAANGAADAANTAAGAANDAAYDAMIAATQARAAAKRNFYDIPIDDALWEIDYETGVMTCDATTIDTGATLTDIASSALFSSQIELPSGDTLSLYELRRKNGAVLLMSDIIRGTSYNGKRVVAEFTYSESDSPVTIEFSVIPAVDSTPKSESENLVTSGGVYSAINSATPLTLHVLYTEEVITADHTYRNVVFATGEPAKIYANRNSRDMRFELPTWNTANGATVMMRLNSRETDENGTTVVEFMSVIPVIDSYDAAGSVLKLTGYRVAVFFRNGVYQSAIATHFTKTLDNRFIVTLTPTNLDYSGTMDKTPQEITAAYNAGQKIVFDIPALDARIDADQYVYYQGNIRCGAKVFYDFQGSPVLITVFTNGNDDHQVYATQIFALTPAT